MTEFTFLEVHFEDGSIPAVGELASDNGGQDPVEPIEKEEAGGSCCGGCRGGPLLGLLVLVLGVVLAWKLLGSDSEETAGSSEAVDA